MSKAVPPNTLERHDKEPVSAVMDHGIATTASRQHQGLAVRVIARIVRVHACELMVFATQRGRPPDPTDAGALTLITPPAKADKSGSC